MIRILLLALLCAPILAGAQCGFDGIHQWRLANDSAYAAAVAEFNEKWAAQGVASANEKRVIGGKDTFYEIPLVLHVIHNGEPVGSAPNPSDTQLQALVRYTNDAFDATWPAYPSPTAGGVRTRIRFVLAKTDLACAPTNGIVRVNASSLPGYAQYGVHYPSGPGQGAEDTLIKKLSVWNYDEYMNVYIVNRIDGPYSGYATLPYGGSQYATMRTSGLFIVASSARAGTTTLVHELGHYLGLYHTFEGDNDGASCPPLSPCNNSGDFICDTEPDKRYPDCINTMNACTGTAYKGVQHNFMNYTFCDDRFTPQQRDRMLMYVKSFWAPTAASRMGDTLPPQPAMVPAQCTTTALSPAHLPISVNGPVLVTFNDIYRVSRHTRDEGRGSYVDNTCRYRTTVRARTSYPISVHGATNFIQSTNQDVRIYLDLNNDGQFQPPRELILTGRSTGARFSANITIPNSGVVLHQPLRMRIVCDSPGLPDTGPCGALKYGQAEDYAITVLPPAANAVAGAALAQAVSAYPNPAGDMLHLRFDAPFGGTAYMYNFVGQAVYREELELAAGHSIRTDDLPQGMYILELRDAGGKRHLLKVQIRH